MALDLTWCFHDDVDSVFVFLTLLNGKVFSGNLVGCTADTCDNAARAFA